MANIDSPCPFERAEACVTCPTSFVPFGKIVRPSVDFTASVVCAVICSPGFAFFESMGVLSAALIAASDGGGDCAAAPAAQSVAATKAIAKDFMTRTSSDFESCGGWVLSRNSLGLNVGRDFVEIDTL